VPRQARLDSPGTLHHVMIRGIERGDIVSGDKDREEIVFRMGDLADETRTKIYAWAVMSNHAHILLRSGPKGLSGYMRKLLSSYASYYNRRHVRHGHLFQNRYKSIVCEEDPYFMELVRYIHLNPVRSRIVQSLSALDSYRWCGHAVILGRRERKWQDTAYVVRWFGSKERYREFVNEGVAQGQRPELVGGGLIRSQGGWSAVKAMRQTGEGESGDKRVLGGGDFVDRLLTEAEEKIKRQLPSRELETRARRLVDETCSKEKVSKEALVSGSRRGPVSRARARLVKVLVGDLGLSLAECARQLGVTTPAIAQILKRS
jgi:putative transposase